MEKNERMSKILKLFGPVIAVIIAFLVAGLIVFFSGGNPVEAYGALLKGAFGSISGIKNTIRYTLPIVLLGFSFAICSRAGYFNIGQEGQMYAAALVVAWIQLLLPNTPNPVLIPLMVLGAVLAGGFVCLIPAVLKFLLGVDEVIIAMLMNYVIVLLTSYLLNNSSLGATGKTTPMSITVNPEVSGVVLFIIALAIVAAYAILMKNSVSGFRLRMIGYNPSFSKASGIKTIRMILIAAFLGGAFSAISSTGEIFGVYHRIYNGFVENLGFYGMTAALIGSQSTIGLVLGSLILGALQSGSVSLSVMTDTPSELVLVVQGLVMLFATINVGKFLMKKMKAGGVI